MADCICEPLGPGGLIAVDRSCPVHGETAEQRHLIERMRDDAVANGDYESASDLDALLRGEVGDR